MMTIEYVTGSDLYNKYPGETQPQGAYVWIDLADRSMGAESNPEIGNAVPERVWHGHVARFPIPALREAAANALLDELVPLAERMCDGYESEWDGSNHIARLDDDARAAGDEIDRICEIVDTEDAVAVVDAAEWYAPLGNEDAIRRELGITGQTTDEQLDEIAHREMDGVRESGCVDDIDGLDRYLTRLRDEARDEV